MSRRPWALCLGLLLAAACARGDATPSAEAFRPLSVGDAAPVYAARTFAGDSVKLGGAGQTTLVNVWATWCESCREEMADLETLHRELGPRGLRVVAVSVDRGAEEGVRRFIEAQHTTFAVAHDPAGRIQKTYAAVGVPSTYLIGRDGKVLWRLTGNVHPELAELKAEAEKALR